MAVSSLVVVYLLAQFSIFIFLLKCLGQVKNTILCLWYQRMKHVVFSLHRYMQQTLKLMYYICFGLYCFT